MTAQFLPTSLADLKKNHVEQLDIIMISGDAYVDHPSFGPALIARYLEAHGFRVGIIPQPNWRQDDDFLKLGKPKLFFGVAAGNLDSMVANYTADKKPRRTDMYTPGNASGRRPDRATIVYTNKLKALFPGVPVVLGGVEASLRRFAHYDYWDGAVRRPILFDAKADYLVYGMAEKGILGLAEKFKHQTADFNNNPNTVMIKRDISDYHDVLILPSYEEVVADKKKYAEAFRLYYAEGRKRHPRTIIQPCQGRFLVVLPPENLSSAELDGLFTLPFIRAPHPVYGDKEIPAWGFVKDSTISHRGCFGGCSFCAISQHQGKYVVSRSLS